MKNDYGRGKYSNSDNAAMIVDAVSEVNMKKNPAWNDIESMYGDVDVVATIANPESIIFDDRRFSGILVVNLSVSYDDGRDPYKDTAYVTGDFSGTLDENDGVVIDEIKLAIHKDD